jgi:IS4 transposase
MTLSAATIAAVYKERWAIELFFKALKQSLRVKTFVGSSANALKTQIWAALIAMLLIKYLQLRSTFSWSLSNLVALLRQTVVCLPRSLDMDRRSVPITTAARVHGAATGPVSGIE